MVVTHPIAKRLAVALPIIIAIISLREHLGKSSAAAGFFIGAGACIFADWILCSKNERRARLRIITIILREHWAIAVQWGVGILLAAYFLTSGPEPSNQDVKQVRDLVGTFGLIAVFVAPIVTSMVGLIVRDSLSPVINFISRFLNIFLVYSMALWLIGYGGDDFYEWALAHPRDAAISVTALTVMWIIIRFSRVLSLEESRSGEPPVSAATVTGFTARPTTRDYRYAAAHEAGHALVYAALNNIPTNVRLTVNDCPDAHGTLGSITSVNSRHRLEEKSFAEWQMLVLLAGKLGETIMYGESTTGSSNDHLRWLSVARHYLANHYRGMYYSDPQSVFEQEQNGVRLEALQAEQLAMLHTLFDINIEVYRDLANMLLEVRTMGRNDLIPFLNRVKLPNGFPAPYDEADV